MLNHKQNFHHSKLPEPGQTGYLSYTQNNWLGFPTYFDGKKQKYQCVAYPLCDNVLPYSKGIHTAYFRNLANGRIIQASGFYFI